MHSFLLWAPEGVFLIYTAAAIVIFVFSLKTPADDGSRIYARDMLRLCAMGIFWLGRVASKETDIQDFLYATIPAAVLVVIAIRLYSIGHRPLEASSKQMP
jgi:hypothetical protein